MKAALVAVVVSSACARGPRDAVPPTRDVIVEAAAPSSASSGGYEYIARRRFAVVAVAEARGIDAGAVHKAADQLADHLEACVASGPAARSTGAARVVAHVAPDGAVAAANVRLDPGPDVAATAMLCLVAPCRGMTFPAATTATRGFAVEALWGPALQEGPARTP